MSRGDIWLARSTDKANVTRFPVYQGSAASIAAGEPVIVNPAHTNYVCLPSEASITSGKVFVGIAMSDSTDTASADGYVDVAIPGAATTFRAKAKTKASLASTVLLTRVVLDKTSSKWTIDESTTTNGFCLMTDYNSTTGEVDFLIDQSVIVNQ